MYVLYKSWSWCAGQGQIEERFWMCVNGICNINSYLGVSLYLIHLWQYLRFCRCPSTPAPIQDLLKTASSSPSSTLTVLLFLWPMSAPLLRALIWLAAICFVKQWSICLTGGAVHSTQVSDECGGGGFLKHRQNTQTGSMSAFGIIQLPQSCLVLLTVHWSNGLFLRRCLLLFLLFYCKHESTGKGL